MLPKKKSKPPIFTLGQYIHRIEEYFGTVTEEQEDRVLFRGQSCDNPLLPKPWRKSTQLRLRYGPTKRDNIIEIERQILNEFKLISLPFLQEHAVDDFDYLAIAQHYG